MADPEADAGDMTATGGRVRELLVALRSSQTELARQLGLSPGYVSEIARGIKRPGADFFVRLRRELNVSVDWLISGQGSMFCTDGIKAELFETVRLQIATARAAVVDQDPTAKELLQLLAEGRLDEARNDIRFSDLLEKIAPNDEDLELAVTLYNGHSSGADSNPKLRQLLDSAVTFFRARASTDKLGALTGRQESLQVVMHKPKVGQLRSE